MACLSKVSTVWLRPVIVGYARAGSSVVHSLPGIMRSPQRIMTIVVDEVPGGFPAKRRMSPLRILVVDDHELARRGICQVLSCDPNIVVVSEAVDGVTAVQKAQELHPDIILMDITLPGKNGVQAAANIRQLSSESRIIFVSQHVSLQVAREAMGVGGCGYVVKSDAGYDLLPAIEAACEGRIFVSRTLLAHGWNPPSSKL